MTNETRSYRARCYKHQVDLRGLKQPEDLTKRFGKMAKWYKCRIGKFLPRNRSVKILDLPCGYGNFLYFLKSQGLKDILGVDSDLNQIKLVNSIGLDAVVSDATSFLNDKNKCYDLISSLDFLEHLTKEELLKYLDLSFRALKDGGKIILRVPCSDGIFGARDRYNDITHETGFTSGAITNVLKVIGFKDIIVLDERPQSYKFINLLRVMLYICFTKMANIFLWIIGLSPPRIWTTSMWIVAKKVIPNE